MNLFLLFSHQPATVKQLSGGNIATDVSRAHHEPPDLALASRVDAELPGFGFYHAGVSVEPSTLGESLGFGKHREALLRMDLRKDELSVPFEVPRAAAEGGGGLKIESRACLFCFFELAPLREAWSFG